MVSLMFLHCKIFDQIIEDIFNALIKCGAKSPPMPEKLLTLAEDRW